MKQRLQNLNDSLHPPLCIIDEVLLLHGHPAAGGAVAAAVLHDWAGGVPAVIAIMQMEEKSQDEFCST